MMERVLRLRQVLWLSPTARGRPWKHQLVVGIQVAWARLGRRLEAASDACYRHHCKGNSSQLDLGRSGHISLVDLCLASTMEILISITIRIMGVTLTR